MSLCISVMTHCPILCCHDVACVHSHVMSSHSKGGLLLWAPFWLWSQIVKKDGGCFPTQGSASWCWGGTEKKWRQLGWDRLWIGNTLLAFHLHLRYPKGICLIGCTTMQHQLYMYGEILLVLNVIGLLSFWSLKKTCSPFRSMFHITSVFRGQHVIFTHLLLSEPPSLWQWA